MYKLICDNDPKKLGIANDAGNWDMKKFDQHVKSCEICKNFVGVLIEDINNQLKGDEE